MPGAPIANNEMQSNSSDRWDVTARSRQNPHPKRFGNQVAIAGNAMMISRSTMLIAM